LPLRIQKCTIMKKVVFVAIALLTLCLTGCKDMTVSTQYTIGCLGFESGAIESSDWDAIEDYFKSHVAYNEKVTYEGRSQSDNDGMARQYYDEQMAKIDTSYVCTLLANTDSFVYGIATLNASGTYRKVKAMTFRHDGVVEESE